jgi:hypothetical protein
LVFRIEPVGEGACVMPSAEPIVRVPPLRSEKLPPDVENPAVTSVPPSLTIMLLASRLAVSVSVPPLLIVTVL